MTIGGKYVKTFAEATHALPEGMHMNADYPFMLPVVVNVDAEKREVAILGRGDQTATALIRVDASGREFFKLAQSSTFERIYGRRPKEFRFYPFRDELGAKR